MPCLRSLFVASVLAASGAVAAEPSPLLAQPFPGLRTQTIQDHVEALRKLVRGPLAQVPTTQQISYDAALAQPLQGECGEGFNTQGIGGIEVRRLLSMRLDRTSQARVIVCFDPGASNDPAFALLDAATGKPIGVIDTDHLVLPGNGFLYALGRTNKLHVERRKYALRDGKVVEVRQPFLYVGLETRANVALTLAATKGGSDVVASIPKGERLTVVLSDEDWMLVKTGFGLVGWFRTQGKRDAPDIEGIYFDGD